MRTRFLRRFSAMSAGLWVAAALLLGAGVTYIIEQRMLERTTVATLDYYQKLTRYLITEEDFVRPKTGEAYEQFDATIRRNFLTPRVFSVKIYDREGTLTYYSLDRAQVGRRFPDNPELVKALAGEVVLGLSDLRKGEQAAERQAGQGRLLEVYIPILGKGSDEIIGAYEIYSPVDPLYSNIRSLRIQVWSAILGGLVLLYAALWWVFRRASVTIVEQNRELQARARELQAAYDELRETQSRLLQTEKLASAGRLAAGVVHEIGNPLAAVVGLADLHRFCRGTPQDRRDCEERAERIAAEVGRLKRLLQGLLDYARPRAVALGAVDLNRLIEEALFLLSSQKEFRGIEVKTRLWPGLPPALADEGLIQQVLINVLINAAQAMPKGGRLTVATVSGVPAVGGDEGVTGVGRRFRPADAAVTITITDEGSGIPPDVLQKIFEPFYSTKEAGRGVGLGLAICHRIIEQLPGGLVVQSRPGAGTTCWIILPEAASRREGARATAPEVKG